MAPSITAVLAVVLILLGAGAALGVAAVASAVCAPGAEGTPCGVPARPRDVMLVQLSSGVHGRMQPPRELLELVAEAAASEIYHPIENRHGICIDAYEGNKLGGGVHMWSCDEANPNQWWLYDAESGQIKSNHGVCLDTPEGNQDGGKIHMWSCDTSNVNQQWTFDAESGQIKLRRGICVDSSQRNQDGGLVHMWACDANLSNQQWHMGTTADTFEPLDGGIGRVCRGATSTDNSPTYYSLHTAASLADCKILCMNAVMCTGIEYRAASGRCEVWSMSIGATLPTSGFQCLLYQPTEELLNDFETMDGGANRACRGITSSDTSSSYYLLHNNINSLEHCKMLCVHSVVCTGIEYNPNGRCEVWTQPIHASAAKDNFVCLRHQSSGVGTITMTTTLASACASVLNVVAEDPWSSSTCGQRIAWYQSPAGGSKTEEQALAQVALVYSAACEPCWPWAKYKAPEDTTRSPKRGIAIQNHKLAAALANIAGMVSWGYCWSWSADLAWPAGGPSLREWDSSGIHYVPMVWGEDRLDAAENEFMAGRTALLGFNEPNFHDQANLSPERAAALWPRLEQLAVQLGVQKLVSPALNFNTYHPADWLARFFEVCSGCRVDAIALHSYTCHGKYLKDHLDIYRVFGKPLWLTEFACSDWGSPERLNLEGQMAYMREAVPMLEQDSDVEMYAWFSYFEDEWGYTIQDGKNGDAGLVNADGSLSQLGQLYASFAAREPVATPVPTTLPGLCHTAQAGEPCHVAVTWAMSDGITAHPEWYPGLSSSSSFKDFQSRLHDIQAPENAPCPAPC